jgi:polar amino acid transport system substrate-binding protein
VDLFQSKNRIVAGVSFDVPGLGYKDPRTGAIDGFEVDVVRAVVEKLTGSAGQVEFTLVKDKDRIAALQSGRVDLVASQLTITPDRAELVDFTHPYYLACEGLLVRADSPIRTLADLAGRKVSVTDGSISERRMRKLAGVQLVVTPFSSGNVEAVESGAADAASNDLINLGLMKRASADPERLRTIDIGDAFDKKPFAIAVKLGSAPLVAALNGVIDDLKAKGVFERLLADNMARVGATAAKADY